MKHIFVASLLCLMAVGTAAAYQQEQKPVDQDKLDKLKRQFEFIQAKLQEKKLIDVDKQPGYIFQKQAKYPAAAIKDKAEGTVWVDMTVTEEGKVEDVRLIKGARGDLDTAALTAAKDWLFTPAEKNGKPIKVHVSVPFRFKIATSSNLFRLVEIPAASTDEKTATAGVEIKHLIYNVPRKHRLNFTVERYIEGRADRSFGLTGHWDSLGAGKQELKVTIDARGTGIRFTFNDGMTLGLGDSSLKNYTDNNTIVLGASLMEKIKTPFIVYVAGKKGRGALTEKSGFQDVLAMFDLVIVVNVELEFL